MGALRVNRMVIRSLTCHFRQTNTASISSRHVLVTANKGSAPRSYLHSVRGNKRPLLGALFGRQNQGQLVLVNAVAIRHNSTWTTEKFESSSTPSELSNASTHIPVSPNMGSNSVLGTDTPPITEQIAEAPLTALDVLQGVGAEASLSELGLVHFTPVGFAQKLIEVLHVSADLPWWGAIVAATVLVRCAVIPLVVISKREATKLHNVKPELTKIMDKVNDAKSDGNLFEHSKAELKRKNFLKKHSISQYKGFLSAGVQAPIFFSFFFGLRSMAELPVPSLQTGGLWWFTDLTACDPYHILPVLVSFSMFCVIKMGAEFDLDPKLIALKKIFMCLPIVLFPFFKAFPMAVNFYWLTSNSFALVQTGVLQLPAIRKRLRIPTRLVHSPSEGSDESVFAVMKKDWQRIKLANQLDVRERKIKARLDLAAKGPLKQTFAHNPLQQSAAPSKKHQRSHRKKSWEDIND